MTIDEITGHELLDNWHRKALKHNPEGVLYRDKIKALTEELLLGFPIQCYRDNKTMECYYNLLPKNQGGNEDGGTTN